MFIKQNPLIVVAEIAIRAKIFFVTLVNNGNQSLQSIKQNAINGKIGQRFELDQKIKVELGPYAQIFDEDEQNIIETF